MTALFRGISLDPRIVPTRPVAIDRTHKLGTDLFFCAIPALGLTDLASGVIGTPQSGTTFGSGPSGVGLSGANWVTYPSAGMPTACVSTTVHAHYYNSTAGNVGALFSTITPDWAGAPYNLGPMGGAGTGLARYETAAGDSLTVGTAPSVGDHRMGGVKIGTGNPAKWVYLDGASASLYDYNASINFQTNSVIIVGHHGTTAGIAGNIYSVMLWSAGLSADLMAWLNAEPYAMLRPIVRRSYYTMPPSGGVKLTSGAQYLLVANTAGGQNFADSGAVTLDGGTDAQAVYGDTIPP